MASKLSQEPSVLYPEASSEVVIPQSPIDYFSNSRLRRNVLIICGLLLINKLGTPGNLLCYAILFAWAIRSPQYAIKAVSINGLIIMASSFFVTRGGLVAPLKYLLLFVAGMTILRFSRNPLGRPFLVLLVLFGITVVILSLINDYFVAVSLLKAALFTFGAFSLLNAANLRVNIEKEMSEWAFSVVLAVVILSFAALAVGAGYGSYESIWGVRFSGYRGFFSHPQSLGVAAGLFAVFVTGLLLFAPFSRRKLATITLLGLLILIYLSEARTGMFAYILAIGLTLVLIRFAGIPKFERMLLRSYQRRFVGFAIAGIISLIVVEGVTGSVSKQTRGFVEKGEQFDQLSTQVVLQARKSQRENSWENFKKNYWTGIGFGTDLSPAWQRNATLLSASTEKGFLPTAILEEVGVIGALPFGLFLIALLVFLIRTRRFIALACVVGFLMLNLGEMVFFSFGGMAMLSWSLISMSICGSNLSLQALPTLGRIT